MRVIWLVTFVVLKIAYFGPIAYHHYRLVSMEWTPLYIVALKASVTICHVGLYFMEDYQRPKLKGNGLRKRFRSETNTTF